MIECVTNRILKKVISLKQKKVRHETGLFVIEGVNFVKEIPSEYDIDMVLVSSKFSDENLLNNFMHSTKIYEVPETIFKTVSDTKSPQGILAVVNQKNHQLNYEGLSLKKNGSYIILDGINDPGNMGTIIRTADACGIDGVFISSGSVDLYNQKVLRSTMGSIFHIPIYQNIEILKLIDYFYKNSISIYASSLSAIDYPMNIDLKKSCAFIIGNEARGVSNEILSLVNNYVKIPMIGKAESFNVSVASGILMYEIVRQRINR